MSLEDFDGEYFLFKFFFGLCLVVIYWDILNFSIGYWNDREVVCDICF